MLAGAWRTGLSWIGVGLLVAAALAGLAALGVEAELAGELRETREDHVGARFTLPLTAGFFDFNPLDVITSGPPRRVDSLSIVPGVELSATDGERDLSQAVVPDQATANAIAARAKAGATQHSPTQRATEPTSATEAARLAGVPFGIAVWLANGFISRASLS